MVKATNVVEEIFMKSFGKYFSVLAIVASFAGSLNFAHAGPYIFWVNNNYDRWHTVDGNDSEQDDLGPVDIAKLPAYQQVPDYNYTNAAGQRAIPCTRDLEDFARLWVAGVTPGLIAALPTNSTLTLSWSGVTGNPTIDLFSAADPGIGFQTNETVAIRQIDPVQCPYFGRISPSQSIQFTKRTWPTNQFIWCGVDYGYGALNLTIADGNGNTLVQTPVYIELEDIKQMYERWTVGDNPNVPPLSVAQPASDFLGMLSSGQPASPTRFTPPQDTNTPYILFVHGWNVERWEKDRSAETAFKRLYWQGYQGRFGEFRWPTGNKFSGIISAIFDAHNYDNSESNAWASATGLLNKLNDLNVQYPGHVYLLVHSMGNVVAGEALRLAGNNQLVNTYVAMQGAIPAHCYDPSTVSRWSIGPPDRYAYYWTSNAPCYFNSTVGAGTFVNFFNANDYALNYWTVDQDFKPDIGYQYVTMVDQFMRGFIGVSLYFPTNTYEIFSYADPARSYALGAQADVNGVFNKIQVDLQTVWPPDNSTEDPSKKYSAHKWHSAEFRSDYPSQIVVWRTILGSTGFNLK